MVNARTIKNRMEFVKQKARGLDGRKLGWSSIHRAALGLDVPTKPMPWVAHQFFPDKWAEAQMDGLLVSICPLWAGGFRWQITGERRLTGDCDSMDEAKRAVEKAVTFLLMREAQE